MMFPAHLRKGGKAGGGVAKVDSLSDISSQHRQYVPSLGAVSEAEEERSIESDFPFEAEVENKPCSSSDASSSSESLCCSLASPEDDENDDEMEVQSSFASGPLFSLHSLESSLPIKKGLSCFYNGKSRSFSCLADVRSINDIPKPENPYTKRRRNLASLSDRSRFRPPVNASRISKKPVYSSPKSTLALAVAMSSKETMPHNGGEGGSFLFGVPSNWKSCCGPSRSFSLSDLHGAGCQCSPERA